ncbi:MAG: decaprenyl-phosphate phosphoribosyltransferase [Planctomycetota bacterium]|nr:decaprenyl-phosphate phosphoribosyltransferase [Planctomycetota bacterium]
MRGLYNLVLLARPSHWLKNVFVLAALLFSREVTDPRAIGLAAVAFAAFCLASSAIYALNDVLDRKEDARHPVKRERPVASGRTSVGAAVALGVLLMVSALAVALTLPCPFLLTLVAYLVVTLAYIGGLKRIAVLDVLLIALGFVIRAYAGGVAIGVPVSPWLILCTLTLALFLGFAKRKSERVALGEAAAETRLIEWQAYEDKALDHMMTVSAALAIATYMLYTVSPEMTTHVVRPWMFLTVLPVVYAMFRFYRLAIAGRVTGPVEMVRRDPAFVGSLVVWVGMVAVILFV